MNTVRLFGSLFSTAVLAFSLTGCNEEALKMGFPQPTKSPTAEAAAAPAAKSTPAAKTEAKNDDAAAKTGGAKTDEKKDAQAQRYLVYPYISTTIQKGRHADFGVPFATDLSNDEIKATSFSIKPALPKGMKFDEKTGQISGAPEQTTKVRAYTVSCKAGDQTITQIILFNVVDYAGSYR